MNQVMDFFSGTFVPIMILLVGVGILMGFYVVSRRYKKIPPGKVGIFYGRKSKFKGADGQMVEKGFRVVASGGGIVMPFVENYQEMDTSAFQIEINEKGIPNMDNVPINVQGIATCNISITPEDLLNAAQNFLGKSGAEIQTLVKNILQGHLRSIIGNLDINDLLRKRDEFNKKVIQESTGELKRLGIQIINLVIKDVNDAEGYIESLGKKAVAEAKREADIKVAEATRDTEIQVSNATKEAATVKAQNEALIAEAEKDRDLKKASYQVERDTKQAEANTAMSIATAEQEKTLKIKQAERDAAEKEAQLKVEEKEGARVEAHLKATVIKQAEANKQAAVINAEAAQQKLEIEAAANKKKAVIDAEAAGEAMKTKALAQKEADTNEGEGQKAKLTAEADGKKAGLLADADGLRAKLTAEAEGDKAKLLATAEGRRQSLLAEAAGVEAMQKAMEKMSDQAKLILILDRLPILIEQTGEAGAKIMESIFKSAGAGLSNVDNINIVDMGGGKDGNGSVERMSMLIPNLVFKMFAQMKAMNMDISGMLEKIGIKTEDIERLFPGLGVKSEEKTPTVVEA